MASMPIIEEPFQRVVIDLVGPIIPPSSEGHQYILTLVDCATRYPEAIPLKSISSQKVVDSLLTIFMRLGVPREILSDNGTQFTSNLFKDATALLNVKQLHSSIYHPMTQGLVEKFNGTLKGMLKRMCSEQVRK
jgi:transposase InsO family protein